MVLNKVFNKKCVEQLAWRGYMEFIRICKEKDISSELLDFDEDFDELSPSERAAWIGAADRILELAIWEVNIN